MEVFEAIYTRRSIRKFSEVPLEFDKIVEVCKAGMYAPCAGDLQNWRFIIETKTNVIKGLYHHTLEQEAFMTATAAIVVVAETETAEKFYGMRGKRLYAIQNCAAAIQNMLLAAHAIGLGAVWIGAFDENRINDQYRIPSTARAQAIILLGYPDEKPLERKMKDPMYVLNFHKYGSRYDHPHLIVWDMADEWNQQGDKLGKFSKRLFKRTKEKLATKKAEKDAAKDTEGTDAEEAGKTEKPGMKDARAPKGKDGRTPAQRFLDSLKKPEAQRRKK